MELSQQDIKNLRKRLDRTDGGIKGACAEGGISDKSAWKILTGRDVRQATFDAFIKGLQAIEVKEREQKRQNSLSAAIPAVQPC